MTYAHSLPGRPPAEWEPLSHHLAAVGEKASAFAEVFGWAQAARASGLLHDIGKTSDAYLAYIQSGGLRGPDHSTAGAREAARAYPGPLGRMLAYGIAGHHAGLADGAELNRRLTESHVIESYRGWEAHAGSLPSLGALRPTRQGAQGQYPGFGPAFLTRMLFSCLVDADFLETEAFYARAEGRPVERGGHTALETLRDRLRDHMAGLRAAAADTPVNVLRARVLDHAIAQAGLPTGFFTLTVPTGGGKTLASLSFALEHAVRHGLRRVIYVIPFTSIIEQTAAVFRAALNTNDDVLEHHASFDWERATSADETDDEGPAGLSKLRKAAENWDAPVVVTTAVQFFESLFANRSSRCRKLHNLAGAVIVLDEAQSLPLHVLKPCLAALDELQRNYRTSVVLCTATQPAWRKIDGALVDGRGRAFGLDIPSERELAPDPQSVYEALKRVHVETLDAPVPDETITARFAEQDRMLCIVNSRAHARSLFEMIRDLPGATHLTTLMCPRHRREVLEDVRTRLEGGQPVRLVATSLIEAGVDVDFPEVWRATAGIDSIAQAAGRCNREGKLDVGRTVVFTPVQAKPPRALEAFWQAARPVVRDYPDLLSLDAVSAYFRELYWQKGDAALDTTEVDGRRGVLAALRERANDLDFPFRSIARAFRLIDDVMEPVIVPWNEEARSLLRALAVAERPRAADLRRLQQYMVSIPRKARDVWLALGVLKSTYPSETLLAFTDDAHYRSDIGLDLADLGLRSVERNLF